jgi:phage-related protein (TIGR01555 family)
MSNITRVDSVEALARLAGGSGYDLIAQMYSNTRSAGGQLDRGTQQYLYRKFGILRKLVDTPVNQMTYRWGGLNLGGEDADIKVREDFDKATRKIPVQTMYSQRKGLSTAFGLAQKAANKTGNGAILLDLDDGGKLDEPVNFGRLKSIKRLFVLNRWSLYPLRIGQISDPDLFQLGSSAATRFGGDVRYSAMQTVHRSRILWFRGQELDDEELVLTGGVDDSVFEAVFESFFRYQDAICGCSTMLKDFDVFVQKITGLLDDLANDADGEHESLQRKRLEVNDNMRRVHRTTMIDKDLEDLVHSTRQVAGYSDLLDRVLNDFLAQVDLTPSELLGKYPEGMADTGKVEQQNANDRTSRYQHEKFYSNIMDFLDLFFRCKQSFTKGKPPKEYEWEWELLYPVTPNEQAELQLNFAQLDDINIRNQIYFPDDAATRYASADFQPNITIDMKAREKRKQEQQAQAQQQAPGAAPEEGNANPEQSDIEALLKQYQTDSADTVLLLPPYEVRAAAKEGLKLRRAAHLSTFLHLVPLANKLSMGDPLNEIDVRSLRLAFTSPQFRKPQPANQASASILWMMLGGDAGDQWSAAVSREMERRSVPVLPPAPFVLNAEVEPSDGAIPIKRAISWQGYQIGLRHEALDERHGKILPLGYGEFLGLISEHDGMNTDVYVGPDLESPRVFAITQLDYDTGAFDEVKFMIGLDRPIDEVARLYRSVMTPEHFGGIQEIDAGAIASYMPPTQAGGMDLERRSDGMRMDKPCGNGFIKDNFQCSTTGIVASATIAAASGIAAYLLLKNASPEIRILSSIGAGIALGTISHSVLSSQAKAQTQVPKLQKNIQLDNFGRPLFAKKKGWKPEMTPEEAEVWAKDSVVQESVFHGTTSADFVAEIRSKGFDPEKSVRGELSDGIYLTRDKREALKYSKDIDGKQSQKRVIEVRPNISRPLLLGGGNKYNFPDQAIIGMGHSSLAVQYEKAHAAAVLSETGKNRLSSIESQIVSAKGQRDVLRALGFDGIYTANLGWVIAFDPQSITAINSRKDSRADDDTPIKRAVNWQGYQIGLQYQPLDDRHGKILPLGYGEFLGIISEHDGMNADVYVGPDLSSPRVFAITQLDYDTGAFDEVKFIVGLDKPIDEVAKLYQAIMTPEHFGGIQEIEAGAIASYMPQTLMFPEIEILVHTDTDPLQVKGRLLSGKEWENIAEVDEAIAQAALKDWQDAAPVEQFGEILDAGTETDN